MMQKIELSPPAMPDMALISQNWGACQSLVCRPRFRVRHLVIRPGRSLHPESHLHRAEQWVVVAGAGRATIGSAQQDLFEGQTIDIPLGEYHGLTNHGKVDLHLIEIQTGICLDNDYSTITAQVC